MDKKRYISLWIGIIAITAFVLSLWYVKDIYRLESINYTEIYAEQGVWDLRDVDFDTTVVRIKGNVLHIEGDILTPDEFEKEMDRAEIGDPIDVNEGRTAKLVLLLPEDERYKFITTGDYARNIYINGELVGGFGVPATNAEDFVPAYGEISAEHYAADGVCEMIIQGGNFVHREGASYANTLVGYPSTMNYSENMRTAIETFMVGMLFVLFIIHTLVAFLFGNKKLNILFAFVCLLYAIRLSLIGAKVIYDFFPQFPWELAFRLEYITVALSSVLLINIVYLQFQWCLNKFVIRMLAAIFGIFTVLFVFTDTEFVSHLMVPTNVFYGLTLLYLLPRIAFDTLRKRKKMQLSQRLAFVSLVILFFAIVNDSLYFVNIYILGQRATIAESAILLFSVFETIAVLYGTMEIVQRAKKAQTEAIDQARNLKKLNTMKTEFLQNMSHEMKTPLTVISTGIEYTKMELEKLPQDEKDAKEALDIVKKEVERLGRMVNGMVSMLFIAVGENRKKTNFSELATAAANTFRLVCESGENRLHAKIAEDIPYVFVDHDSFMRVLTNVFSNANKNTRGGEISIIVDYDDEFVYVIIEDNGSGIPENLLPHVTKRGVSGGEGSGLGLYITNTIIEAHGGNLTIKSVEGEGTKVMFTVPVYAGQEEGHR